MILQPKSHMVLALIIGPCADSCKIYYTPTLLYTTDTILPVSGLPPQSLRGLLRIPSVLAGYQFHKG